LLWLRSSNRNPQHVQQKGRASLSAQRPIVVVGSINLDLVGRAERIPTPGETLLGKDFATHPGGKGANQAVAVARLGYPVRMIGRLGDDGFGTQLREHLTSAGVDVAGVRTSPGSSGVAIIVVAATGENSIVVIPGANALLTPQDLNESLDLLGSASVVLTQLETPLPTILHLAELCLRLGVPLILDPAPAQALPKELLSKVAWFTPNETEAAFYTGNSSETNPAATANELMGTGLTNLVLKLGSRGAYLAMADGEHHRIASFPVDAVDSTAAGDCFNGAFATGLALHMTPAESARFAAAAAALSVTRFGAQPSMPSRADVQRLLDSHPLSQ
jgi:ribokinase